MQWQRIITICILLLTTLQYTYAATTTHKTTTQTKKKPAAHAKAKTTSAKSATATKSVTTTKKAAKPIKEVHTPPTHPLDTSTLWGLIASNFRLPHYTSQPEVQRQIAWFQKNPQFFQHIATQGQPYLYYIYTEVKKRGLPGELVLLPMIESAYDPFAYSWVGAAGLWQMMPATGANFGLQQDWWFDGRKDIIHSTKAALDYLTYLRTFFNGNWPLAIGAYNAGEGRVQSAVDKNARRGAGTTFWTLSLPAETKSYVPRFFALAAIVNDPKRYHVKLPHLQNGPQFNKIDLDHQIELSQAAKMAGIPLSKLYELNPGYSRWATDPKGPYHILLPVKAVERFERNYNVTYGNRSLASSGSVTKNAGQVTRQAIVTTPQAVSEPSIPAVAQTKITAKTTMTPTSNSVATQPTASAPVSTNNEIRYTVKTGDTLWNIAKRFNVTVGELRTWNKLSEKAQVKVGNVLLIKAPAVNPTNVSTYTVKVGDTLFSIAQAHGLHLAQIVQSNPQLNKDSKLTPGTVIFLPPKN